MKKHSLIAVILFCAFIFSMALAYLLIEKQSFSQREKRYLQEPPALNVQSLLSGSFSQQAESYMADHIPLRDFFVGLNSAFELVSLRQQDGDVLLISGGRLVEAPTVWNESQAERNMSAINALSQSTDVPTRLLLIPSAGWAAGEKPLFTLSSAPYMDREIIGNIFAMAADEIECMDLCHVFEGKKELYYRTDHHWTSEGAYLACREYMELTGRSFPAREEFRVETAAGFHGANYSRAALWTIASEELELWHGPSELSVECSDGEGVHQGLFYYDRLMETDKYTVYLDGNHPLVRIDDPAMAGEGRLLVIRDSYSNVLGGFLAESFESVLLVDPRYYKNPISELLAEYECTELLICYSLSNFMTDPNLVWIR